MAARQQAISARRNSKHSKKYRRDVVQVANEQINGNKTLCDTQNVHSIFNDDVVPHMPLVSAGGAIR